MKNKTENMLYQQKIYSELQQQVYQHNTYCIFVLESNFFRILEEYKCDFPLFFLIVHAIYRWLSGISIHYCLTHYCLTDYCLTHCQPLLKQLFLHALMKKITSCICPSLQVFKCFCSHPSFLLSQHCPIFPILCIKKCESDITNA